jgi:polyvinyl alcohol dehydrogenase (cytochrome)
VTRRLALLAACALVAAGLAAAPARAAEQQAYATALNYATPAVLAAKGDTLRFTNLDPLAQHDIVSDTPGQFSSPLIGNGQSALVSGVDRLAPATYQFHCSLHAWMRGALQVVDSSAPGPPAPPQPPTPGDTPNPVDLLPKLSPAPLTASEWPLYGHDLTNSRDGGPDGPSWNEVPTMGPVWSFRSASGDFTGTPVVAAGTLVALAGRGTVYALDASTGKLKWSRDLGKPLNATAAIAGGRVYVPVAQVGDGASAGPRVVALNLADGAPVWDTTLDTQPGADTYGSPVVWNGAVYIGTSALFGEVNDPKTTVRGTIVALDAATGAQRWKHYTVPAGRDGGAVWNTPAIDAASGTLYAGTGNAYHEPAADTTDSILALNATTGQLLGHFQATAGDVWNETSNIAAGPDADFGASLNLFAAPGGRKLVGAGQKSGTYWALDRATLQPAWNTLIAVEPGFLGAIVGSTAYDGHGIYGPGTAGGEIWGLGHEGSPQWVSADGGPLHFGAVSVANGVLYSTDMSGHLTARDVTTGAVLAKLPLGAPSWGGVSIAGGYVFAVTGTQGTSGYVVAYRPRT